MSYLPAMMDQRINSAAFVKALSEPMKILLRVRPSKEMHGKPHETKKNIFDLGGLHICRNYHHYYPRLAQFCPRISVRRATDDQIRRPWVRFPPRTKIFFFLCDLSFPY